MAVLYEKVATKALSGFHRQVALDITSSLPRGRVLDVGTGPGHLLVEIARRNAGLELVGVDLSRRMLKIARQVTARHASARPELVRGDVRSLPFSDGAFDLVVSTLSLHHWRNPVRGMQECLRVTAPGGQCWIYDLRTDVPARRHAELVTTGGFRGWVLGWIFKFHGVDRKDYGDQLVAGWMGGGSTTEIEAHPAYLKIAVRKAPCQSQQGSARDRRDLRSGEDEGCAVSAGPGRLPTYVEGRA